MAQIVTITNPLTGQPAQVDQLDHTAQEIDDAIARALPGGAIDTALQKKVDGLESTDYPGCYYRTVDGVVEWLNPPMLLGVEYRTTERYLGKPVYVKAVNFVLQSYIDCATRESAGNGVVDFLGGVLQLVNLGGLAREGICDSYDLSHINLLSSRSAGHRQRPCRR